MRASLEFFLGLHSQQWPAAVAREDFTGPHGALLRLLQRRGLLAREAGLHPVPSCPHCGDGAPYPLRDEYVCNHCASTVDARHLQLWRLDLEAFLRWLARELTLRGGVRPLDGRLWQLGRWESESGVCECFYWRCGPLGDAGRRRLAAYRSVVVLYGLSPPPAAEVIHGPCVSLLEVLRWDRSLRVAGGVELLRRRGNVRFDAGSGALWVGEAWLGEVPLGSKEFFFLDCLAAHLDHFVAYADLKYAVLRQAGSTDTTEEATFCQGLKCRIKKKWMLKIDLLLATTNKGDGYRLRGYAEV